MERKIEINSRKQIGSDRVLLGLAHKLPPESSYTLAEVTWTVRHEMAHTVEDVLARRLRELFLNARAAPAMTPAVANIMARELKRGEA